MEEAKQKKIGEAKRTPYPAEQRGGRWGLTLLAMVRDVIILLILVTVHRKET
jgi:hypothetical protein